MASFTANQWEKVFKLLNERGGDYGLPERRDDSVVLASFNIRKLGKVKSRSKQAWDFLTRFLKRCNLVAVQEVLDNLEGLNYLKGLLGESYGMVASDITGGIPGGRGMTERLAFLFHWPTVSRTEVASDISYDRSAILETLFEKKKDFWNSFNAHNTDLLAWNEKDEEYKNKLQEWKDGGKQGKRPPKPEPPVLVLPHFLAFIRTPLCVSFRVEGLGGAKPYEFLAVSAHLLYGDKNKQKEERKMEFEALMKWLVSRAKQAERLYHRNIILLGDLNLDFEKADKRRDEIDETIKAFNKKMLTSKKAAKVNFPFLDVHPGEKDVFRTNARQDQTYDQIGLFMHDRRLPRSDSNDYAGDVPGSFDFGMFNFTELFSDALEVDLKDKKEAKRLFTRFEHDVSDHMPIWIRLPKPYPGQPKWA